MRRNLWIILFFILIITVFASLISWPKGPNFFGSEIKIHEGLDLQGGTHLVYEMNTSKITSQDISAATQSTINVIENRVNGLGVAEPVIQTSKIGNANTIIVELPGISDVNEAISLIGKTAQLKFQEQDSSGQFVDTSLTGANLKRASVDFDKTTGAPQISLQFDADGTKIFANLTERNVNKPLAITLDNQIISAPVVSEAITSGQAVINGQFSVDQAKQLAIQLNAGALPVPLTLIEQQNIGATLGNESVKKSLVAGLVGLILIAIFMIVYYKIPGIIAVLALTIYSLIVISLYKIIPVTLTLAGIAGFILSIGMAVDANILIFERTKEELGVGKNLAQSFEEGFRRAWPSIRDSNISSLITAGILYYGTSGIVRGFAVTLAIGIIISMFTAITVSRTFLRVLIGSRFEKYLIIK